MKKQPVDSMTIIVENQEEKIILEKAFVILSKYGLRIAKQDDLVLANEMSADTLHRS